MATENNKILYGIRDLAKIIIEAKTPFRIGSGLQSLDTDSTVLRDFNGLPYIPGTSLAGILRRNLDTQCADEMFGSKENGGSRLIISEAKILGKDYTPVDYFIDSDNNDFLNKYKYLQPIRQHVRIGDTGTGIDGGKFDEEIVFKGTRLCFEMEYLAQDSEDKAMTDFLAKINSNGTLQIGSGVYHGFGEFEIKDIFYKRVDLTKENDLSSYLRKSSCLNSSDFYPTEPYTGKLSANANNESEYIVSLTLKDFFFFGGNNSSEDDEDMTPICETYVKWGENKKPTFAKCYIIPGASIKGALSHRIAFHYNVLEERFIENLQSPDTITGKNNEAVKFLFGSEGDNNGEGKQCGKVVINDIFLAEQFVNENDIVEKRMDHVVIDSFSGGAIAGGLFSERVLRLNPSKKLEIKIIVKDKQLLEQPDNKHILQALENTLNDLKTGMLALGGNTNRGYGVFTGEVSKDGEKLEPGKLRHENRQN